jgi:hypothetical protein
MIQTMKNISLVQKLLIIIALAIPFTTIAKNPVTPKASVDSFSGIIVDKLTQEELGGAYLYFEELQKGVYSEPDGKFNLEGIVPGDYKVTVKYISYHEKQVTVKVKKSRKNHKIISLEPVLP